MPYKNPPKRSEEYRKRAGEVRAKADAAHDKASRDALLQEADTWERMADYEDKHQAPGGLRCSSREAARRYVTGFLPPDGLLWRPPPNSAHDNLVLDAAHAFHVASDLSRALTFALGIHSTSELDISVQRSHAYVAEMNHRIFYGGVVGILRDTLPALKHVTGPDRRGQNQGRQQADC
jgi:hypothetical protein